MTKDSHKQNKQNKVRYAVVGLGWISQSALLPGFANARKNSELVALVSDDDAKLKELGKHYGVPPSALVRYDGYSDLVKSGAVDAVYIGLPNHLHADYTIRAAKAGVHVLCEKPMAVTEAECERMIRAARDNNVKLMIAYRLHFEPANLRAIELVNDGGIGEPRFFVSTHTQDVEPGNVRLYPVAEGGGPVYDIGVYCINAARYLLRDEPTEVFAVMTHGRDSRFKASEEMASVVMRFPKGRMASFTCSFSTQKVSTYSVIGTEGTLTLDPGYSYNTPLKYELVKGEKMQTREFKPVDQFGAQLDYFSDCVLNNRKPEPSGEEGLNDVRIVRAIHTSARTGKPVALPAMRKARRPHAGQKKAKPASKAGAPKIVKAESPSG